MTKKSIIDFPCTFPIKIVGINSNNFLEEVKDIVLKHFPDFVAEEQLSHKTSKENNYLAITVTVLAKNQGELDAFYQEISSHPQIKMVL